MGRRRLIVAAIIIAVLTSVLSLGSPAEATFRGNNGFIAFTNGGDVWLVSLADPSPVQITFGQTITDVDFRADGRKLVVENSTGLALISPKAGTAVTPIPGTTAADNHPSFDRTGKKIAFDNGGDIFTASVHNATTRTDLTSSVPGTLDSPDWSPNGKFIAFDNATSGQILSIPAKGGSTTTLTPPAAGCTNANNCAGPTVSPDSTHVGYGYNGVADGIYEVLASGASAFPFQLSSGNDDLPAFSPNGHRIAFQNVGSQLTTVATDGSGVDVVIPKGAGQISWGVVPHKRH